MLVAINSKTGISTNGSITPKDTEANYRCPECNEKVIHHVGGHIVGHFQHANLRDCNHGEGESAEHVAMKTQIAQWLTNLDDPKITDVQNELKVKGSGFKIYCDVYCNYDGNPIAFEPQRYHMSVEETEARIQKYVTLGILVVWVISYEEYLKSKFVDGGIHFNFKSVFKSMAYHSCGELFFWDITPDTQLGLISALCREARGVNHNPLKSRCYIAKSEVKYGVEPADLNTVFIEDIHREFSLYRDLADHTSTTDRYIFGFRGIGRTGAMIDRWRAKEEGILKNVEATIIRLQRGEMVELDLQIGNKSLREYRSILVNPNLLKDRVKIATSLRKELKREEKLLAEAERETNLKLQEEYADKIEWERKKIHELGYKNGVDLDPEEMRKIQANEIMIGTPKL